MLVAIDIAILPPDDLSQRAIALSDALPAAEFEGLRLGPDHLPHVTLTQQFISADGLETLLSHVDREVREHTALRLRVTGGGKANTSVLMMVERTPALVRLHEGLLRATRIFERGGGTGSAFFAGDARERDIQWVREFRRESSFERFTPHITLGHAASAPHVEPTDAVATRIAVCHLGRFCTCRRIIREWELRHGSKGQDPPYRP